MDDLTRFERELNDRLLRYAQSARIDLDPITTARSIAIAHPRAARPIPALVHDLLWRRLVLFGVLIALIVVALVAMVASQPPHERLLLFVRSGDVFVSGLDRPSEERISRGDADGTRGGYLSALLSPDGSYVAALLDDRGATPNGDASAEKLEIMSVRGDVVGTFDAATTSALWPSAAWAPSGRELATLVGNGRRPVGGLFILGRDGSVERQFRLPDGFVSYQPEISWSPDGRWILVTGCTCDYKEPGAWIVAADGSGSRRLGAEAGAVWTATWSPDSQRVAFAPGCDPGQGSCGVWIADVATGSTRRLTSTKAWIGSLAWSPDGRRVAETVIDRAETTGSATVSFALELVSTADGSSTDLVSGTGIEALDPGGGVQAFHVTSGEAIDYTARGIRWTDGGRGIVYWTTDIDGAGGSVREIAVEGGSSRVIASGVDAFDVGRP